MPLFRLISMLLVAKFLSRLQESNAVCTACLAAQVQDSPAQRRAQQLQAQLADASAHLAEALYTQQQYTDVVQQLKQGHADSERQLEQLRSQLAGQQQLIAKVCCCCLGSNPTQMVTHPAACGSDVEARTGAAGPCTGGAMYK